MPHGGLRPIIPIKVVRRAWKEAKSGHLMFIDHSVGKGVEREVKSYPVIKDKKMVIVISRIPTPANSDLVNIIAFPRPEHFDAFEKSAQGVRFGGDASNNPEAVGTLNAIADNFDRRSPTLRIMSAQSHFMVVGNPNLKNQEFGLSRSLATKHGGWTLRCLRQAMKMAIGEGRKVIFEKEFFRRETDAGKKKAKKEIYKICREIGLTPIERGGEIYIPLSA